MQISGEKVDTLKKFDQCGQMLYEMKLGGSDDTAGEQGQRKHYQHPVGQMMQVQAFYTDQESNRLVAKHEWQVD